jgi:putative tricarboxylic transport membrane protein
MRLDLVGGIFWLVISIIAMMESYRLNLGSWQKPGSGFLPFLAASFLAIFSIIVILGTLGSRKRVEQREVWPNREGWSKAAFIFIILLAYTLGLEKAGFAVSTFLLMLLLLKTIEPQSWMKSLLFSFTVVFISYIIFHTWLKVPLPSGLMSLLGF